MSQILVVDDEQAVCWALERALKAEGHKVAVAASAEEAFALAEKQHPEAIILDVRLPGMDGLSALGRLREITGDAPTIVATAFGNLQTAVRAVEQGAFDYLAKPFDLDQALETVKRALARRAMQNKLPAETAEESLETPEDIVGASPAMHNVFKRIALVAPRDSCVLITGESGAGKELVARAIHRYSTRRDRPFLPVNVAALNPSLVESELFGHVKGAFTGAAQPRPGLLALADGGTIFFDEVADIPLAVQVKLLRVLEHNEIMPVGSSQSQPLNVRVLAATHQHLEKKIAEGSFRHDLFFRLNVFQVHLPPLRERREDILPLAEHFLRRIEPMALPLAPATVQYLQNQTWLGNVRELRNALEHAAIVARGGPLLPEHFPVSAGLGGLGPKEQLAIAVIGWLADRIKNAGAEPPKDLYEELLRMIEPPLLEELMRKLQGNRWVAAQWLGLNRATVRKKLTQYGLADVHKDEDTENA
ncbi:MAG: sigma-54 dependent transcriptional regulator [Gemmataceae bacterium]|nr:sigma-54 dependent transcriptional regulator [Gemmataceae bacterium]MCI0742932.1 sigma-54 dependent transcriptional regulator [Gemmataceae bacterium]